MSERPEYLAWLDLESTGSDETADPILEIGMVLTNTNLDEVADFDCVVKIDRDDAYERSAEVVREMHTANGLWDALDTGLPLLDVESECISFFQRHGEKHDFILAGSGVAHFDRRFLKAQMPRFEKWLRYYSIDVGVLRRSLELIGREDTLMPKQDKAHRALEDARLHLEEMRHIKKVLGK
jgi:oligoribonuclease